MHFKNYFICPKQISKKFLVCVSVIKYTYFASNILLEIHFPNFLFFYPKSQRAGNFLASILTYEQMPDAAYPSHLPKSLQIIYPTIPAYGNNICREVRSEIESERARVRWA